MSNCPAHQLTRPLPFIAISFTRDELLSYNDISLHPTSCTTATLRKFRLLCKGVSCFHHYRGRKSGKHHPHPSTSSHSKDGRSLTPATPVCHPQASRGRPFFQRHSLPITKKANFGLLNIRSVNNKIDDLCNLWTDKGVDILLLTETWHDVDSVFFKRLLSLGFAVVDQPRPRARQESLSCNHGGVAILAVPGFRLKPLKMNVSPTTFEFVGGRITSGSYNCSIVVIYRTGVITNTFFSEFSDLLDRISVMNEDVVVAGDFNIRLEKLEEANTKTFGNILNDHGFIQCVNQPTHEKGGILDAVAIRSTSPVLAIEIIDTGLSDHFLIRWSSSMTRPPPIYKTSQRRSWKSFNLDEFIVKLQNSSLTSGVVQDLDDAVAIYNTELFTILDRLLPLKFSRLRQRPSDPWFDDECRQVKKKTRRLERTATKTLKANDVSRWKDQLRVYRKILRQKREGYWRKKLETERQTSSRALWTSLNSIMGRGRVPINNSINADKFLQYFQTKIKNVRDSTALCQPPSFSDGSIATSSFDEFLPTSPDEVIRLIHSLPNKQCSLDPIPTWLLKKVAPILAPFLANLFNKSLAEGKLPQTFKMAHITPVLKKPNLDISDTSSYRPISNLSVISKLLERLVHVRITNHLNNNNLFPLNQSAYRRSHSTETAVLKVFSDALSAADNGKLTLLVLLDLSAAFDTVDHSILLQRLGSYFGLGGSTIKWFDSYLNGRSYQVRINNCTSSISSLTCGVPQGSVLGPTLFSMYITELEQIILTHGLQAHFYADDTQIYGHCEPHKVMELSLSVSACVDDVSRWMCSNRLQLNSSKSEVIWLSTCRRRHQRPAAPIRLGMDWISPSDSVRNLGTFFDADLSMSAHVSYVTRTCFLVMRNIKTVAASLPAPALKLLLTSLVLSRLDYCNSALVGLPKSLTRRLQSVINASARLVTGKRRHDHITPILQDLQWLRVDKRISLKLVQLVFKCLHQMAPSYLAREINFLSDIQNRKGLRSSTSSSLYVPPTHLKSAGDRSFTVAGPRLWNHLPTNIKTASSLAQFNVLIKAHLHQME